MYRLIIDTPSLRSLSQRYTDTFMTFLFWAAWLYLWIPLVSFLAWFMGFKLFYHHMIVLEGYRGFGRLLLIYLAIIVAMGAVLLIWARYNQQRFGKGKSKRKAVPPVTPEEMAVYFKMAPGTVEVLINCKIAVVWFDMTGGVNEIEVKDFLCEWPFSHLLIESAKFHV